MSMRLGIPFWIVFSAFVSAQPVINELAYDDTGVDDREFIEIFNPGPSVISPNSLTLENRDAGGLSAAGLIVFPLTPIPVGGYYVLGNVGVPNLNQNLVIGALENDQEVVVLRDAVTNRVLDTVTYESGQNQAGFPVNLVEGTGVWGGTVSNDLMMQSLSRTRDGYDTDNNGADFCVLPWTPGTPNSPSTTFPPLLQNFDSLLLETPVPGWIGSFESAFVIDPNISGPLGPTNHNPSPIPPSPQGGRCMTVVDPAGQGTFATPTGPAVRDFEFEAWVYFAPVNAATGADFESWSIGVRGTTDSAYVHPSPNPALITGVSQNGNTGVAWEYVATQGGAVLYLRDENDGGPDEIPLAAIPITLPNFGWQRLRLSVQGNQVDANFGGVFGNPSTGQRIQSSCTYVNTGTFYIGYRENLAANQNSRPICIDDFRLLVPTPEYQISRAIVRASFNQTLATPYHPAHALVCPGQPIAAAFESSLAPIPFELAINLVSLRPASSGGVVLPDGQIVNIDLSDLSLVFMNGGLVPAFVNILYPFEFAFPAPNLPGFEVSIQAVILDPSALLGISLSQGSSLKVSNTLSDSCRVPAANAATLLPQVSAFAVQLYDNAGLPQPLTWITTSGLVTSFVNSILVGGPSLDPINDDLEHSAYVQTLSGTIHRLGLVDISNGLPGSVNFLEGQFSATSNLHATIELAYGLSGYVSNEEAAKEKKDTDAEKTTWTEEELIPKPVKTGPFTGITLIIHNDNDGEDFLKKYAEQKAAATGGVAFKANGLNSIINELRRLYGQCKVVDCLIIACHGSPGSFRIGPQSAPYSGPSRVGRHPNQITPRAFGKALRCYLGTNPAIKLMSCETARMENMTTGNGTQTLQDLADGSGAMVSGADQDTVWPKRPIPNPNCVREPKTRGAKWAANPAGMMPTIMTPAPVPPAGPTCLDP